MKYRKWFIVAVSFMIMFIIFATCISCMGIYAKPVAEDLGVSRTAFSLTITIGSLAMMVSAIITGRMMGKYSIKLLMTAGALMCAASMTLYSAASSIAVFYLAAVLMGISVSLTCNIPISVLIKDWFGAAQSGTALGIAFVGSGAGAMILNPLYTGIIESYGWRCSFRFAAICIVVLLVPLILLTIKLMQDRHENDDADKSEKVDGDGIITLSAALKKPATWIVFTGYILIAFVTMVILNHGVPFMTDYGISALNAAKVISAASGVLIIGKIILGALIDKIGAYKATLIGTAALLLCILAFWTGGLIHSKSVIILFVLMYGLGGAVATVSMPGMISLMYGNCDFGAIMGFFSMTAGAGGMLQVIVSMIYDAAGNYNPAWIMVSILCLITIIVLARYMRPLKN